MQSVKQQSSASSAFTSFLKDARAALVDHYDVPKPVFSFTPYSDEDLERDLVLLKSSDPVLRVAAWERAHGQTYGTDDHQRVVEAFTSSLSGSSCESEWRVRPFDFTQPRQTKVEPQVEDGEDDNHRSYKPSPEIQALCRNEIAAWERTLSNTRRKEVEDRQKLQKLHTQLEQHSHVKAVERLKKAKTLEDFTRTLPRRPYCNVLKDGGFKVSPRSQKAAAKSTHIQPNPPGMIHWLIFDVDAPGAALSWSDAQLPTPHIVAMNPANGHAHWFYRLAKPVCVSDRARSAPQRYLEAIKEGFYLAGVGIDPHYRGLICKNPISEKWKVTIYPAAPYELGDLAEFVQLPHTSQYQHRQESFSDRGRNCNLFDRARQWAYCEYQKRSWAKPEFERHVLSQVEALNDYPTPLPVSEVRSITRSITRFCVAKYNGRGSSEAPSKAHQRKAQKASAKARVSRTQDKIKTALTNLAARQERITAESVARESGCGKRTVERHAHLLPKRRSQKRSNPCVARPAKKKPPFAYQITARERVFLNRVFSVREAARGWGGAGGRVLSTGFCSSPHPTTPFWCCLPAHHRPLMLRGPPSTGPPGFTATDAHASMMF